MTPITTMLCAVPGVAHLDDGSLKHLAAGTHLVEVAAGAFSFVSGPCPSRSMSCWRVGLA
jgi:hypothetical protein